MSRGRSYTVESGQVALTAGATQTPILMGQAGATVTVDCIAIRVGVVSGASPIYPTLGSVQWYLANAANTPAGGTAVTPRPSNGTDIAANSAWTIGTWTTAPTQGNIRWGQPVPFTPGPYGEVFDRDLERRLGGAGASAFWAIFATLNTASTSTLVTAELDFIE